MGGDMVSGRAKILTIVGVVAAAWWAGVWGTPVAPPAASPQPRATAAVTRPTVDKSPEMQKGREVFIEKMKLLNVIQKIETPGNLPRVYVAPAFYAADFDSKRNFMSVVYAYHFDGSGISDLVRIYDGRSGKEIGTYSPAGLRLF